MTQVTIVGQHRYRILMTSTFTNQGYLYQYGSGVPKSMEENIHVTMVTNIARCMTQLIGTLTFTNSSTTALNI